MKVLGRDILKQVAGERGLSVEDVTGKSKRKELLLARLEIIARLRAAGFGIARMGRLLNRNHSTISHHVYPAYRARNMARARRNNKNCLDYRERSGATA